MNSDENAFLTSTYEYHSGTKYNKKVWRLHKLRIKLSLSGTRHPFLKTKLSESIEQRIGKGVLIP